MIVALRALSSWSAFLPALPILLLLSLWLSSRGEDDGGMIVGAAVVTAAVAITVALVVAVVVVVVVV